MRSLTPKLILAFLIVSLTSTAVATFFALQTIGSRFGDFIYSEAQEQAVMRLATYYDENGASWAGIDGERRSFDTEKKGSPPKDGPRGPSPERDDRRPPFGPPNNRRGPFFTVADQNGQVVLRGIDFDVGDRVPPGRLDKGTPIEVDGEVVGTLITDRHHFGVSPAEAAFVAGVTRVLAIGGLVATVVGLLLAVLLARSLTRPLRELTTATRAVAKGELEQEVPVRSQDELGELAASFNQMSTDLARSRDLRRQMTADIAHELRTPLSIILGHAEALYDEVLPPTRDTFYIILDEAERLQRLIEDLRTLSLAEAGELPLARRLMAPHTLLEKAAAAYRPGAEQKNISLQVEVPPDLPEVDIDPDRMAQVLGNLLGNALRYTPSEGHIRLSAQNGSNQVQIKVHNSGAGIALKELSHIFNRFYRGDKSRKRHDGGSGLGLAIAKSIVEGHNGRIWAESQPGQGVTFIVQLPV
ncbi:MAG: sensor histidine kinase [Ardenticatenaceae bacterium]